MWVGRAGCASARRKVAGHGRSAGLHPPRPTVVVGGAARLEEARTDGLHRFRWWAAWYPGTLKPPKTGLRALQDGAGTSSQELRHRAWRQVGCGIAVDRPDGWLASLLVLYHVSSAAFRGRAPPLGRCRCRGERGEGKGGLQIVYGLLCSTAGGAGRGRGVEGNTADPNTLAAQIGNSKIDSGCRGRVWLGIGACFATAHINDELRPRGWPGSARCAPRRSKPLVETGVIQLSLFGQAGPRRDHLPPEFLPASGWCAATTPPWPTSAPTNGRSCSPPTRKTHPFRRRHRPRQAAAARQRSQDRATGRQGDQPHGQALHHRDHRRVLHVPRNSEAIAAEAALAARSMCCAPACPTGPHRIRPGGPLQETRRCRDWAMLDNTIYQPAGWRLGLLIY